jgi:hypothetical protein
VYSLRVLAVTALLLPSLTATDTCPTAPSLSALAGDPFLKQVIDAPLGKHRLDVPEDGVSTLTRDWLQGKRKGWAVELQRGGGNLVTAGAVLGNHKMVDAGLRMFEWAFTRQDRHDGSFPESEDRFHSTSVFLMEVNRSLLLLKENSGGFAEFMPRVDAMLPEVTAAAHWFLRPGVLEPGKQKDQPFTHRKWILAFALGGASKLSGDPELARAAVAFAKEGVGLQQEDGRNPERGGYDVSYQMVDALMGSLYYTTLECPASADLMGAIRHMLEKTCRWEMKRMLPDGAIDVTGSTRMGIEHQHNGNLKSINYPEVVQAFVFAARITGNPEFLETAKRIAASQGWPAR